MLEEIYEVIKDADMVLVGLGEEINDISSLKNISGFVDGRQKIEEMGLLWLLPAYDEKERRNLPERQGEIREALGKLAELLSDKNYFVVSTSVNDIIMDIPWKEGRLVMPCGGSRKKQCINGCEALQELSQTDKNNLSAYLDGIVSKSVESNELPDLGKCPDCGKPFVLNNIYTEHYNENGYLSQWQLYTKWLQGTLNRKVVVLELGVGMKFPSVIRWPFEKVAFFNQKAKFYRVNENLYQMSEELKDKGVSISKNSIDWLRGM